MTELVATENPEEEELRRKKEELADLENQLADLELEAAALLADTQAFLDTVTSAVDPTLLELDLLRAKLAEARLSQEPDNEEFVNQADTAREEARQAQQEYDSFSGSPGASQSFDEFDSARRNRTSEGVRSLYKNLVKLTHPDLTAEERRCSLLYCVFPSFVVSYAPDVTIYLCLQPKTVDEVAIRWGITGYAIDPHAAEVTEHVAFCDNFNAEDRDKLEAVQRGLKSRFYTPGPLAPTNYEGTVWDFYQYMASRLASDVDSA